MRSIRVLAASLLAAAVMSPMTASAAAPSSSAANTIAMSNSLAATPEELAAAGFAALDVEQQRQNLSRMSSTEKTSQSKLRQRENRYSAGDAVYVVPPPAEASDFQAAIVTRDCTFPGKENRFYRVTSNGGRSIGCYAGAGTYNVNPDLKDVRSLRPGLQVGRVLYRHGVAGTIYWSLWRGPSQTDYKFEITDIGMYGPITVFEVQISSGPTD